MSRPPRVAINLRVSAELREALRTVARRNGRSVTAEIVRRLERSIRADERWKDRFDQAALTTILKAAEPTVTRFYGGDVA